MLVIIYYNNFTDLKYSVQEMNIFRTKWIFFTLIIFVSSIFPFCSSRARVNACKGNNTYRGYISKKNKSKYAQKYSFKSRSVKKDYVIKNGTAH